MFYMSGEDHRALMEQIAELKEKNSLLERIISLKDERLEQQKRLGDTGLQDAVVRNKKLEKEAGALARTLEELTRVSKKKEAENKAQVGILEEQIKNLSGLNTALGQQISLFERTLPELQARIKAESLTKEDFDKKQAEIDRLNAQIAANLRRSQESRKALAEKAARSSELEKLTDSLKKEIEQIRAEADQKKVALRCLEAAHEQAQAEIKSKAMEIAQLLREIGVLKEDLEKSRLIIQEKNGLSAEVLKPIFSELMAGFSSDLVSRVSQEAQVKKAEKEAAKMARKASQRADKRADKTAFSKRFEALESCMREMHGGFQHLLQNCMPRPQGAYGHPGFAPAHFYPPRPNFLTGFSAGFPAPMPPALPPTAAVFEPLQKGAVRSGAGPGSGPGDEGKAAGPT